MDKQIFMQGFEPPEYQEMCFLDSIFPFLTAEVSKHGGDPEFLTRRSTKSEVSPSSGYSSVYFGNLTSFRIHLRGKQHYISLPIIFKDLIPTDFPVKRTKSEPKYIRLLIDNYHTAEFYADFLAKIAGETVNRYPKDWDCCSRYMECSEARFCVHPDKMAALSCGYRKILNSGRVFFGTNRNIDQEY